MFPFLIRFAKVFVFSRFGDGKLDGAAGIPRLVENVFSNVSYVDSE